MLAWPVILAFLKNNWKIIAIGLAITSLMGYIGFLKWEVKHYKTKYEDAQLVIAEANSREAAITAASAAITRKYENIRDAYKQALALQDKTLQEKIKNDKELAALRISANLVQLFNESKHDPSTPASPTIEVHDGEASTTQATTGTTLFSVIAENDSNHWKCIKQVEDWQNFWHDYESATRLTGRNTSAAP